MNLKSILVPVDFSPFSDNAVDYALFLAEKFCAKITLFHAITLFHEEFEEDEHFEAFKELVEKKEKECAQRLGSHCTVGEGKGVSIESVMSRGFSAADLILDHIAQNDGDLVVMGTHGRTGLSKWLIGSVAHKVIRHSSVPLVTIHKEYKKHKIKNVLVPVDFSDYSKQAVEYGIEIAKTFGAKLHFLFVVTKGDHEEYYNVAWEPFLKANPHFKKDIKQRLIDFTGLSKAEAIYDVVEGKAHQEINEYAEGHRMDLVVMGRHGTGALEHLLMGSTTERVVQTSPFPVLTVPGHPPDPKE
jgi:nucleotide-binding universal stress UspA family protein